MTYVPSGMTIKTRRTAKSPPWGNDGSQGWNVVLDYQGRQMRIDFWKGAGHGGDPPQREEVLECMALDAASYENARSFEEWAPDFGYDTDSRKAYAAWESVKDQTARLKLFLGASYQRVVWPEEVSS